MSYTIAHQNEIKTNLPDLATQKPQQRGLVASWFLVDGKLVCKWFLVAS